MEFPPLLEVCVVWVVVVWVVVELLSGVVDWLLGEVDDGDVDDGDVDCCELASGVVDCGELPGEVCATAQTADNNRIAVIKDVFLMYVPPGFGLFRYGPAKNKSGARDLDHRSIRRFASLALRRERNESCGI